MSLSPFRFAPLALLCLGISCAHASDARTSLGVRLVIVDSCDIRSVTGAPREDGGDTRIECQADTPYDVSFSRSISPGDAAIPEASVPAVDGIAPAPGNRISAPAHEEASLDSREPPVTTVMF